VIATRANEVPVERTGGASLRRLVAVHLPADARESSAKERFLAELDRLVSPCDRHADPVHVTASAIVVGARGTVLHLHRRLGRWLQPGGHIDAGESPEEAALREATEETGLRVHHPGGVARVIHIDVHPGAEGHEHLDLRYLLVADDAEPSPGRGESQAVHWCGWEEAEGLADEALVGALRAARAWERAARRREAGHADER
jgi:8-oxo-dGTP pyrophosphatase MutT (NUDIX family)